MRDVKRQRTFAQRARTSQCARAHATGVSQSKLNYNRAFHHARPTHVFFKNAATTRSSLFIIDSSVSLINVFISPFILVILVGAKEGESRYVGQRAALRETAARTQLATHSSMSVEIFVWRDIMLCALRAKACARRDPRECYKVTGPIDSFKIQKFKLRVGADSGLV